MTSKTITLAIVNQSTILTASQVSSYAKAQQTQITRDFFPSWGVDARVVVAASLALIPAKAWALLLLDDSDQANALGYHYETPQGMPLGKVFARTDAENSLNWTITASHEALEMILNPWVDRTTITSGPGGRGARLWAYEACDAVEADQLGYQIGATWVSDFVLPDWFQPWTAGVGPWDFMKQTRGPLALAPGGYMSVLDFAPNVPPQWHEIRGATIGGRSSGRHPDLETSPRRQRLWELMPTELTAVTVVENADTIA